MALPQGKPGYTFADYLAWDENERIELINGQPVMQAAPSSIHQAISAAIVTQIHMHFIQKRILPR